MKTLFKVYFLFSILVFVSGCELTDEDFSDIVFDVHLDSRVSDAELLHDNAVEGTKPTQYEVGSKEAFAADIAVAKTVSDKTNPSQKEVDDAYTKLGEAIDVFQSKRIPFNFNVELINGSFEMDGITTETVTDFSNVTGWESTPLRNDGNNGYDAWAKASSIAEVGTGATNGDFVASIASYGFGIYQTFDAALEEGATYSLTGDFRISWSPADWMPEFYDTYVVTRFIVIDGDAPTYNMYGGYNNISVVSENITNLSDAQTTDWESITHEFTLEAGSEFANKQFALSIFIYEEGLDFDDPHNTNIWAESFVHVDNLDLTKE